METRSEQSNHEARGHSADHQHGPACGHRPVQHGDHSDYEVEGRLHHAHDGHCDDQGPAERR